MAERLNVLLVVLNGVRADHLSCYGCEHETTPFLDEVARQGVRFPHMISAAPWTLPSVGSLLTGLHAVTHGATAENRTLGSQHSLLPELLKGAGYRTAAFCTNSWVSPQTGFGRGFDAFFTQHYQNRFASRAVDFGRRAADTLLRRSDAGARRTNHALRKWIHAGDAPFFAFVHYQDTHLHRQPPPPYDRMFLSERVDSTRLRSVSQEGGASDDGVLPNEETLAIVRALYAGSLRYVDQRLGELAQTLRVNGKWDRTVVIVTSDHGENLGEHGRLGHRDGLHDTLLRVPFIVRCPELIPQGFVIDELTQPTDIVPTVLQLLGIETRSSSMRGRALFEQGRATPGPAFVVAERYRSAGASPIAVSGLDPQSADVRMKMIRSKREKFVWRSDEANEYYDLLADPGESRNLIEGRAGRADALRRQLFDWVASGELFFEPDSDVDLASRFGS